MGLLPEPPTLDPDADGLIEETRARSERPLAGHDLWPAVGLGLAFLGVAIPMAVLLPSERAASATTLVLLVITYALFSRVEFEVGAGSAVPTQLVLVPMLYCLPAPSVPLAVAAGLLLGGLVDYASGGRRIGRVFGLLGSSWHSVGPALVFTVAGEPPPDWMHWPIFLAALLSQFVFDFAASSIHDGLVRGIRPRTQLRILAPVYATDAALSPIGLMGAVAAQDLPYAFMLGLPLVWLLAVFARERHARIDHAHEVGKAYRGTAFLLGDVVEADDAYTGSHSRDVVDLVLAVADELRLPLRERRKAELTALLHDVGKIRVPGEMINKPGPLTDEERAFMEMHTIEGERLLEQVGGLLAEVGHVVRSCHERWDGDGYPDGLAGEEIPLIARIVVCCDAFSAMTTTRSYRAALPVETGVAELRANAGSQFDPGVVETLVRIVERRQPAPSEQPSAASVPLQLAHRTVDRSS